MFDSRITGDLTPIITFLDSLRLIDYSPLAETIRLILIEENAAARNAGLDKDGSAFAPLRGGRALKPSEIARRGGGGPPLAPKGDGSRVIAGFQVDILPLGDGAILVRGSWPGFPELAYHVAGAGHNPVRNPVGITPAAEDRIRQAVHEFMARAIGGGGA